MGALISLATLGINTADRIQNQNAQDKADSDRRILLAEKKPITPPQFYRTIQEREAKVHDGPYSVPEIRRSLANDVLPSGYSIEQLKNVGFVKEADAFIKRRNDRHLQDRHILEENLKKMLKAVKENLPSLTDEDRRTLQIHGVLTDKSKLDMEKNLKSWISQLQRNEVDRTMLNALIQYISLKRQLIEDALNIEMNNKARQQAVETAQKNHVAGVLNVVNRSLNAKFGDPYSYKNKLNREYQVADQTLGRSDTNPEAGLKRIAYSSRGLIKKT